MTFPCVRSSFARLDPCDHVRQTLDVGELAVDVEQIGFVGGAIAIADRFAHHDPVQIVKQAVHGGCAHAAAGREPGDDQRVDTEQPQPVVFVPLGQRHETGVVLYVRATGNPAILVYSTRMAPTERPDIGYAMIFPSMTIVKVIAVQVVGLLFGVGDAAS